MLVNTYFMIVRSFWPPSLASQASIQFVQILPTSTSPAERDALKLGLWRPIQSPRLPIERLILQDSGVRRSSRDSSYIRTQAHPPRNWTIL